MKTVSSSSPTASKRVTIRDVAQMSGLNIATVSRALSGKGYVAPQTRDIVLGAARELGYEPDWHAQRLRGAQENRTIAMFIRSPDRSVGSQKVDDLQIALGQRGYDVFFYACGFERSKEAAGQAVQLRLVRSQRPRAIIYGSTLDSPETVAELERYQAEGGIVVLYDFAPPPISCDGVIFDRDENTYLAARHLVELGHRRIALTVPARFRPDGPRLEGFQRALHEGGLEVRPEWLLDTGPHSLYEKGGAVLAEQFFAMRERPTAYCIVNDHAAAAFVHHMLRGGVRVPEELSVVSMDDIAAPHFGITSTTHPVEEIVGSVVDLLLSRLEEGYDGPARKVVVGSKLTVRESSCPPPLGHAAEHPLQRRDGRPLTLSK